MSKSGQKRISRTKDVPVPNQYILALSGEYAAWTFDEEKAPKICGQWRRDGFGADADSCMDLEIGTGNGLHFAHRAAAFPTRSLLGLELKYKPLIQSIRRAVKAGSRNARMVRYNAYLLRELFVPGELNDVFIFFPDPWEKSRNHKHRLIHDEFLRDLHVMQQPGSQVYFKTDSRDYFEWSLARFQRSPYQVVEHTFDLHKSEFASANFITQFESIFMRQGIPIGYARLAR